VHRGFDTIYRRIVDWEWYKDIPVKTLFIHLLLKVNHKDGKWQGIEIKKGQILTGRKNLSFETGLSEQQIRTALKKLESTKDVKVEATKGYSMITLCNHSLYHDNNPDSNQQSTNDTTKEQPRSNQGATTNNKFKHVKNEKKKKELTSESYQIADYLFSKILKINPEHKKPNMEKWAEHADKMLRIDNRNIQQIYRIIDFAHNDSFWVKNILSTQKLREQFDKLVINERTKGIFNNNQPIGAEMVPFDEQ